MIGNKRVNTGRTRFKKGYHSKTQFKKGLIPWNKDTKGIMKSNKTSFKKGQIPWDYGKKLPRGNKAANWKGGIVNNSGYKYIYMPQHPFSNKSGYIKYSRFIIEKHICRYLNSKEVVHHIDRNKSNDNLINLMLFSNNSEHMKFHYKIRKLSNKGCFT